MAAIRNPMETTWRQQDPKTWNWKHRILLVGDTWHNDNGDYPIHKKTDPMPWFDTWSVDRWILTHAAWPVALHALYNHYIGPNLPAPLMFLRGPLPHIIAVGLYSVGLLVNLLLEVDGLQEVARKTGFLDGDKHSRDKVPDASMNQVFASVPSIVAARATMTVALAYRPSAPMTLSPWILAELILYPVVLDFFFYIYHRSTHEVDGLWKYHRTHHLTKHPNPLLSSLAGVEQEITEMAIVPLLTYTTLKIFGFPMGFYDWWLCQCFTLFAEAFGHAGVRAMVTLPGPCGPIMKLLGCELVLEDHDLHHRQGWRKSGNYGKATRLWDRIFGTSMGRIEAKWDNVDYVNKVKMPIF